MQIGLIYLIKLAVLLCMFGVVKNLSNTWLVVALVPVMGSPAIHGFENYAIVPADFKTLPDRLVILNDKQLKGRVPEELCSTGVHVGAMDLSSGGKIAIGLSILSLLIVLQMIIFICIKRIQNDYDSTLPREVMDRCNCMSQLKQIHAKTARIHSNCAASRLITFSALAKAGDINHASKLFHYIHQPNNSFIWYTLVKALYLLPQILNKHCFFISKWVRPPPIGLDDVKVRARLLQALKVRALIEVYSRFLQLE